jgi:hypothetical protein
LEKKKKKRRGNRRRRRKRTRRKRRRSQKGDYEVGLILAMIFLNLLGGSRHFISTCKIFHLVYR